eukprot:scaffold4265_cov105-Isochrysis_galbana.AAC.5
MGSADQPTQLNTRPSPLWSGHRRQPPAPSGGSSHRRHRLGGGHASDAPVHLLRPPPLLLLLALFGLLVHQCQRRLFQLVAVEHVLLHVLLELFILVLLHHLLVQHRGRWPRGQPLGLQHLRRPRGGEELRVPLRFLQEGLGDEPQLLLDLGQMRDERLVGERLGQLVFQLERLQHVDQVLHCRLHIHVYPPDLPPPLPGLLQCGPCGGLRVAAPLLVNPLLQFGHRVLQLIHLGLLGCDARAQPLHLRLRLGSHLQQALVGLLLREEFLDHLVDVRHARRLLDLGEGGLVCLDLGLLGLDQQLRRLGLRLGRVLAVVVGGVEQRRPPLLFFLFKLNSHLLLLLQRLPALLQLLLAELALLDDQRLEFGQLVLGQVLGQVGLVRHEEQLLVFRLLLTQRGLDRLELARVLEPLALQPVNDVITGEPGAVRILVPLRLQQQLLLHRGQLLLRLVVPKAAAHVQLLELVGKAVDLLALQAVRVVQAIVAFPQLDDLRVQPLQLVLHIVLLPRLNRRRRL